MNYEKVCKRGNDIILFLDFLFHLIIHLRDLSILHKKSYLTLFFNDCMVFHNKNTIICSSIDLFFTIPLRDILIISNFFLLQTILQ